MSKDRAPARRDRAGVDRTSQRSTLHVADRSFDVLEATFGYRLAVREDGWRSMIDIEVQARSVDDASPAQQASLRTLDLYPAVPAPESLSGFWIDVDALDSFDAWPSVEWSHGDCQVVHSARLRFGAFDGGRLHVEVQGRVDVVGDDGTCAYDLPFQLAANARFAHVIVDEGWLEPPSRIR
jgi:hypothetical protein